MSKELTPLEALKEIKRVYEWYTKYAYDTELDKEDIHLFNIVKTALKRLEKIETTTHSVLREDISKNLKALEIIKTEMPNLTLLASCSNYQRYKEKSGDNLTQEEYDLLKEILL